MLLKYNFAIEIKQLHNMLGYKEIKNSPLKSIFVWIIGCKRGPCQSLKSGADKQAKLGEYYVLSFCRNLSGQKLIYIQYDAVENFVITLTGVISKLN